MLGVNSARLLRILTGGGGRSARSADLGLLLLRLSFGLALAFAHGVNKLPPSDRFVAGVIEMGFPAPLFFAWASAFAEFFCAILVVIGLATRPAAAFIILNMIVAAFIRQAGDAFGDRELALAYLAFGVVILISGAGRYSADALVRTRWLRHPSN